jgi:hypothetical protein
MTQSGHLARVRRPRSRSLFDPTLGLESREFDQAADPAMKFILEVSFRTDTGHFVAHENGSTTK